MYERIVIVKDKTRMEKLKKKFNTRSQAKFVIETSGGDFDMYEQEHDVYESVLLQIKQNIGTLLKSIILEKQYLSSFLFAPTDIVVVVGRDGLVANTAKYARYNFIVAVNPDPATINGVLLPFTLYNFMAAVKDVLDEKPQVAEVTLATASLNDGQELLAFNDFYIGKADHTSSAYIIREANRVERQSSSGLIITTGAGSTGWFSSVMNEANGLLRFFGVENVQLEQRMAWDEERLLYAVREPFVSPYTGASMVMGEITSNQALVIESVMPENGVIFSDGICDDFLEFNSGKTVTIAPAADKVRLVK